MGDNLALRSVSRARDRCPAFRLAALAIVALGLSSVAEAHAKSLQSLSLSEQTMNRPDAKTCRMKRPCKALIAVAEVAATISPTAEPISATPEQIVNRIEQAAANPKSAVNSADNAEPDLDLTPGVIKADTAHLANGSFKQALGQVDIPEEYGAQAPFAISVDGETLVRGGAVDKERKTDVGLAAADIQVKFDGLDTAPLLSASHKFDEASGAVDFQGLLNYPDFVTNGEFRIYRLKDGKIADLIGSVPVDAAYKGSWHGERGGQDNIAYVFRVYDEKGRFDETGLLPLGSANDSVGPGIFSGERADKDFSASRNIPVHGGSVTVYGRNVPEGYTVKVLGEEIKTDSQNSFVMQKILPPGDHDVDVAIYGVKDEGLSFSRQINIPDNDWFYVGLADFTVGRKFSGLIENATTGEFNRTYTKGRLAFYLKGKIKGRYLLTAAADTGENDIKYLFTGWDQKDPRHLLKVLDPDDYYPVYGDDSSLVEDAPTKGKFYVRLERGASHVMWGNFKTKITGTKFAAAERALYGAGAHYQSETVTSFGDAKTLVDLYAAQPGTVPQRDNFRGTGGSAYFLKRQQITSGSEQVSVEVRDRLTGRVLATRTLKAGEDYEIDYVQGVIILKSPLASNSGGSGAVSSGTLSDNPQHLIVNYEYSSAFGADKGQLYGGRASQWLGEHVKLGVSGSKNTTGSANNEMFEADLRIRISENSYFEAEIAQSKGRGLGQSLSTDGGLTFNDEKPVLADAKAARAYRLNAHVDLGELSNKRINGYAEAFYEKRDANFSALDSETVFEKRIYGASVKLDLTESVAAHFAISALEEGDNKKLYEAVAEADIDITENLSLLAGVTWSDYRETPAAGQFAVPGRNGTRTDIGARLTYQVTENTKVFVFGQTTAQLKGDRLRNDRVGVGAETKLNDRLSLAGDISTGTSGLGGSAAITYESSPDNKSYVGYRLDPERDEIASGGARISGRDSGVIIAGSHRKLTEWLSAFAESNADFYGRKRSLTQVYGITFKADEAWSASLGMELGTILDPVDGDFQRRGFSAKAGYMTEAVSASAVVEARFEDSDDNKRDRNTFLLRAQSSWKTSEDWRLSAHFDALISRSDQATVLDGDYIEGAVGYAYRPVLNDRLNVLFKYAFLYDLPGPQQVNSSGEVLGPAQRSHTLSVDASYDISEHVTIGAKYGFRFGDVSTSRSAQDFVRSTAHLGIVRLDVTVLKNWDALFEGRVLYSPEAGQTDYGALVAVYRHLGNNAKIGVGYNFGRFSDDLTDLTHDDSGVFLNMIGKF